MKKLLIVSIISLSFIVLSSLKASIYSTVQDTSISLEHTDKV